MFAVVFVIFIRPAAGQTTVGGGGVFFLSFGSRKFFLSGHKVDKTISRLRRGWCQRCMRRFRDDSFGRFANCHIIIGYRKCDWCKRGHYFCKNVNIRNVFFCV
jgi:hypothetical protein